MQARLMIGVALIFSAVAMVSVVTYFQNNEAYYTVDELGPNMAAPGRGAVAEAAQVAPEGRRMQVRGDIDKASVERASAGLVLRFTLRGKDHALPVVYEGLVPDTFDMATQVTVGGRMGAAGTFMADQLFVQCPSKYEAAPPGAAATQPANG